MTDTDAPTKTFLDEVYELPDADATRALYDDWAETYDAELSSAGYAGPARCAKALARFAEDLSAPILDVGCGTGLSGQAFKAAGFTAIDGTDFSDRMLKAAESKGAYRTLLKGDLNDPLPGAQGEYAHLAAVGVFSPGHAPAELIDQALAHLPSGGCFVFTLNDHALAEGVYEGRLREVLDCCAAELLFKEHGPHVPGEGLKATVYVLRKR